MCLKFDYLEIVKYMNMNELFVDKYRVTNLDDMSYGDECNQRLKSLSTIDSVPHVILEGRRGSGKRTRALLFLKERFGNGVFNIKNFQVEADVPNKTKPIQCQLLISPYHFQFNPRVHGVYDRVLIQKFIEDIVKVQIVNKKVPFRVVVLEDTDLLTHEAQQSLRRTLETRIRNCRFIFLVNKEGHLIDPIYSRCSVIRVPSPEIIDITKKLSSICDMEKIRYSNAILNQIASYSNRNMSTAIHCLQKIIFKMGADALNNDTFNPVDIDDTDRVVSNVVHLLITGTSLDVFTDIRNNIYELMVNCDSGTMILTLLFKEILKRMPKSETKTIYNICKQASDHDNSLRLGGKSMYHIESFCLHMFKEIGDLMQKRSKSGTQISKTTRSIPKTAGKTPAVKVELKYRKVPKIEMKKKVPVIAMKPKKKK